MDEFPESLNVLMDHFRRLPTIGKKTAQRLALHVVKDPDEARAFAEALVAVTEHVHRCRECGNITEDELCSICRSPKRDRAIITVVEDVSNLMAIERGGSYYGLYHVLNGLLSPMADRGPEEIGLDDLLARVERSKASDTPVEEVILAISATVEGETTMLFLADQLKGMGVKVSRIASGIPVGGSLEYYDELTLARAMAERRTLEE
ncbi:MAG: recombination mediator RecR [Peptoniphilaceae bacterium]|nr:recombination mediator RecR [Peptoniphilaceae bacterium]MDY6086336.1 recombination mediator RecR [Peptoniphilaceae bacterium]